VPSGGTDGLPREDISGKLTASLLKNMNSPDWKVSLFLRTLEILQMWEDQGSCAVDVNALFGAFSVYLNHGYSYCESYFSFSEVYFCLRLVALWYFVH
jgi:hypothetical protein